MPQTPTLALMAKGPLVLFAIIVSSMNHNFLFASLDCKPPISARTVHLRRLYDILQLSIHEQELERAKRVWGILVRCKEFDWKALWTTGLHLLEMDESKQNRKNTEYLRTIMLQYPNDRESILKELIFRLLLQERCREALDELELYLPSFPYQDNPTLHVYAGLAALYLCQSNEPSSSKSFDPILLRDAQTHFEHAKLLDEGNEWAQLFLNKIATLQMCKERQALDESDDEYMTTDTGPLERKRART